MANVFDTISKIEKVADDIVNAFGGVDLLSVTDTLDARLSKIENDLYTGGGAGLIITSAAIARKLTSTNFESGVSGWSIEKSGDVEFESGIFRGTIHAEGGDFSDVVTVGPSGEGHIIIDGSTKVVKSSNFSSGSAGWQLSYDGTLEAQNATISGDITATSGTFTGTIYATGGYIQGDMEITSGTLLVSGAGVGPNGVLLDGATGSIQSYTYASGSEGWKISDADNYAEFNDVRVRGELRTSAVTSDVIMAVGGIQVIAPSTVIRNDLTGTGTPGVTTSNITLADSASFVDGDFLMMKDGGNVEVVQIDSGGGTTSLTVTRGIDGALHAWTTGAAITRWENRIIIDTVSANSPFLDVVAFDGPNYDDFTVKTRVGNLDGISDPNMTPTGYGLYSDNVFLSGTAIFGGGSVQLDPDGIRLDTGSGDVNKLIWKDPLNDVAEAYIWSNNDVLYLESNLVDIHGLDTVHIEADYTELFVGDTGYFQLGVYNHIIPDQGTVVAELTLDDTEFFVDTLLRPKYTSTGQGITDIDTSSDLTASPATGVAVPTNTAVKNYVSAASVAYATDAGTLDTLDSSQFLRSDAYDVKTSGALRLNDSIFLQVGTSADAEFFHNGSNTHLLNKTGGFYIQQQVHGGHIYLQNEDSGGTNRAALYLMGGANPYVRLYQAGSERMRTDPSGIRVYNYVNTPANTITSGVSKVAVQIGDNWIRWISGQVLVDRQYNQEPSLHINGWTNTAWTTVWSFTAPYAYTSNRYVFHTGGSWNVSGGAVFSQAYFRLLVDGTAYPVGHVYHASTNAILAAFSASVEHTPSSNGTRTVYLQVKHRSGASGYFWSDTNADTYYWHVVTEVWSDA